MSLVRFRPFGWLKVPTYVGGLKVSTSCHYFERDGLALCAKVELGADVERYIREFGGAVSVTSPPEGACETCAVELAARSPPALAPHEASEARPDGR